MNFLYQRMSEQQILNFDARQELVSKDSFFQKAQIYISADKETLLYRQELFGDILKVGQLSEFFILLCEKLQEYEPLTRREAKSESREERISNFLYLSAYVELTDCICDSLEPIEKYFSSRALCTLYEMAKGERASEEYRRIKRYYKENVKKLSSVHSVTVGINLTAMLEAKEAGIISLNQEEFKSGDILDRILRLDLSKDDYHCIAPLTVIDKKLGYRESQQINFSLLKAMGRILDDGLQHCSNRILKYLKQKLDVYFEMYESLKFVVEAIKRLRLFRDKKIPLCFPKVSPDRHIFVDSLYDDSLCRSKEKKDIVPNTVCLEDEVSCYILAGPNSGGKSVFLNSLASAQLYFQLGMPIPAKEASLPLCDAVFKVSVDEQANFDPVGRFEKECISLSGVLSRFTEKSMALIDEAFTSTSASDALPIAAHFINELCRIGGKCIFVTHYRELDESQEEIRACGNKVSYLYTDSDGEKRRYTVKHGKDKIGSYALNIAKKYGLLE